MVQFLAPPVKTDIFRLPLANPEMPGIGPGIGPHIGPHIEPRIGSHFGSYWATLGHTVSHNCGFVHPTMNWATHWAAFGQIGIFVAFYG